MNQFVTEQDRDDLYDVIAYCSECASETGNSGLGYCKKHMDPVLGEVIRRHVRATQIQILDSFADVMASDFPKSAQTLRDGARKIEAGS